MTRSCPTPAPRVARIVALLVALLAGAALVLGPERAAAQSAPDQLPPQLTVFLDCQNVFCDRNFFLTELPFVLWTQDRRDAEIHALITGLNTAAGGRQFTIALIGAQRFAGRVDTITTSIPPNTPQDEQRRELARVLKVGLAPYLLRTAAGARVSLTYTPTAADSASGAERSVVDPWNRWVYKISGSGDVGSESQSSDFSFDGSLSAERITPDLKLIFGAGYEYDFNRYELDSSTVEFALRSADLLAVLLKSVDDHWSVGLGAQLEADPFRNQDFFASLDVAAEWNYFPWQEATRRQLVAIVAISGRYFDYSEETIYERTKEFRTALLTKVAGETRQPWGSLFAGVEHIRYLHDTRIYSATVYLNMNVRVSRGVSVFFGGNAERVNDQLYLPRGNVADDEILTEQRALATAYRVNAHAGLSFTFGSIFNNIVNPRFDAYP